MFDTSDVDQSMTRCGKSMRIPRFQVRLGFILDGAVQVSEKQTLVQSDKTLA